MYIGVTDFGHMTHGAYLNQQVHTEADAYEEHDHLDHLVLKRTVSGNGDGLG